MLISSSVWLRCATHTFHTSAAPLHCQPSPPLVLHLNQRTCGQELGEREHRRRLRREVISAVSPQRFPHSTLISSNNVSQTFQLFRRNGGWKEASKGGKKVKHTSPPSLLFHTINLSLRAVVSRKWLCWINSIWGLSPLCVDCILPHKKTCQKPWIVD